MIVLALALVAVILVFCISMYCFKLADDVSDPLPSTGLFLLGIIFVIASGLLGVLYAYNIWQWQGSEYKAGIINREYGTNYTAKEIFFADDVIDKIQEIKRKRIEINGDVMRDQPDKVE